MADDDTQQSTELVYLFYSSTCILCRGNEVYSRYYYSNYTICNYSSSSLSSLNWSVMNVYYERINWAAFQLLQNTQSSYYNSILNWQ